MKDDIATADESNIVTSLDDKSIGPTRSLWLGNIPQSATIASLTALFSQYGVVESTRILSNNSCAFVNYASIESAIQARAALNGYDMSNGSLRIGFAKVMSPSPSQSSSVPNTANSTASEAENADISYTVKDTSKLESAVSIPTKTLAELQYDILDIVKEYGADSEEIESIRNNLTAALTFTSFVEEMPPLPDPNPNRVHDAPKLREIRKRIDNGSYTVQEIEAVAIDMLDEIAELASDYLGNTVVQKLFDYCSEDIKTRMLVKLSPYLSQLGIHKNGTWAAQKVIDVAHTPEQMQIIADSLRPYTVHLFLDQFGNYVLQCCLRFGSPFNDFIFETMLSRFWDIAQGRFGARAMRACLESHYASKEQQRVLAAAITLHTVQLATNANGALLLTWFLDTCTLPNRHRILAPRLIPHLVPLCTHKLASLTVLKVVNYRAEPEARRAIFDALVLNPDESVLEEILSDSTHGPAVIFKIITTPFLESDIRQRAIATVRNVLVKLKVHPSQGYRRLMDEVGLSARS
ncbi:armadillo-type protein, partial [Dipodascopsis uninucleata]